VDATSPPPKPPIVSFVMWVNSSIQPIWSEHTRSPNALTSAVPKLSTFGESATPTFPNRSPHCDQRSFGTGPTSRRGLGQPSDCNERNAAFASTTSTVLMVGTQDPSDSVLFSVEAAYCP